MIKFQTEIVQISPALFLTPKKYFSNLALSLPSFGKNPPSQSNVCPPLAPPVCNIFQFILNLLDGVSTGYCFSPEDLAAFGTTDAEMGWELRSYFCTSFLTCSHFFSTPGSHGDVFPGASPLSFPTSLFSVFDKKSEHKQKFEEEVVINQLRTNDPSLVALDCSQLSCPSVQETGEYSAWVARLIGTYLLPTGNFFNHIFFRVTECQYHP